MINFSNTNNPTRYRWAIFCIIVTLLLIPLWLASCSPTTPKESHKPADPLLLQFATFKERQAEESMRSAKLESPSALHPFFDAAKKGDSARVFKLFNQFEHDPRSSVHLGPAWQIVLEVYDAYEQFDYWDRDLLQMYITAGLSAIESNSIFFGGTDPGRFIFTLYSDTLTNLPFYVVTQNALADSSYVEILRQRYGSRIALPSLVDSQAAFQEYVQNVQTRQARGEVLGPDEVVEIHDERVQVRGAAGVMKLNGILSRWIFDYNKDTHPLIVEESFVIPWMYPYLKPAGVFLKLEGKELPSPDENPAIWQEMISKDRIYWDRLTIQLTALPVFARDPRALIMISKMRSAIGGLYAYRKLNDEAQYAYEQALQLCPISPEANFRLAQLYMDNGKMEQAITVFQNFKKLDPTNPRIDKAIEQIRYLAKKNEKIINH